MATFAVAKNYSLVGLVCLSDFTAMVPDSQGLLSEGHYVALCYVIPGRI